MLNVLPICHSATGMNVELRTTLTSKWQLHRMSRTLKLNSTGSSGSDHPFHSIAWPITVERHKKPTVSTVLCGSRPRRVEARTVPQISDVWSRFMRPSCASNSAAKQFQIACREGAGTVRWPGIIGHGSSTRAHSACLLKGHQIIASFPSYLKREVVMKQAISHAWNSSV